MTDSFPAAPHVQPPMFETGAPPAEPVDKRETVTVSCPTCGEDFTGPQGGKGSANWMLGKHKYAKHRDAAKPRGKGSRAKAGSPTADELEARPVVSLLRAAASEVSGSGSPSGDALAKAGGRALQLVSGAVSSFVVETDPYIADEAEREAIWEALTIDVDTANNVMAPVGKMLAGTSLNAKYGRGVVDNVDVLGSVLELTQLGMRWRRYLSTRSQHAAALAGQHTPAPAPLAPASFQAVPQNVPTLTDQPGGVPAASVSPGTLTSPPPQAGVVMTPDIVAAMRRQNGN